VTAEINAGIDFKGTGKVKDGLPADAVRPSLRKLFPP
jgi:hypothetical protein